MVKHTITLHFMKAHATSIVTAASILIVGCSKHSSSSGTASPPASEQGSTESAAVPVTRPAMTAWQQGNKSTAVSRFLAADWSARPLFPTNSVLSLSEDQFDALSGSEAQAKSGQMMSQLDLLKQVAAAVVQAGQDAAAKGDTAQARKYFTSLEQCGAALDGTNCLKLVQLVGQGFEKRAKAESAKLGQ